MKKMFSGMLVAALALMCVVSTSTKAEAALVAAICNDLTCSGGDDFFVTDGGVGDGLPGTPGAVTLSQAAFGYTVVVNTSQSKPVIGSAAAPQLDLTFTATGVGTIFLYAGDSDFTGPHSFTLGLSETNLSGSAGSVQGRAWGGSTNNPITFSPLLASVGPLTLPVQAASVTGTITPTVNPYSLSIGVQIVRTGAGTTTGDLGLAVPEPASMTLFGLGLLGTGLASRRRRKANQAK